MKTNEIEETVRRKVYVAIDGSVFPDLKDCRDYEICHIKDFVENCKSLEGYMAFDGGDHSPDNEHTWFRPKNAEELDLLDNSTEYRIGLEDDDIDEWICIEYSEGGYGYVSTLTEMLDYVKKVCRELGYEIEIKKKENDNA